MGGGDEISAGQGQRQPVLDSYGRLSKVPDTGELEKIDTQWADNRKVITRVGARLGAELQDGLSAWKRGVRRPGWERLLERVESGESDGIVVWHTDRLFRQPRDLETLIDLGERGFKVYSAHGERDLADPDDRFILRIEVAHAARSSDDTSRRLKRRFATYREQGKDTGGQRRFGFPGKDTRWEPELGQTNADRPEVAGEQVEQERAAIRDAAVLLLSEDGSAQKVADLWNARGLRSVNGLEFTSDTATAIMKRQALGGFVVHNGEIAGRLPGEAVLDKRTFERVQAMYAGRKRGRVAGKSYVGTGILRCAVCRRKLSARTNRTATYREDGQWRFQYFCPKQRRGCGTVYVDGRAVDRELLAFTVERLSDERHAHEVAVLQSRTSDRLAEVRAEIAQIEVLQQGLSERLGARRISLDAFDVANEPLAADLARLIAERDELTEEVPAGPTEVASAQTLADEWEKGDTSEKRAMLTRALGRDRMTVFPADRTGKREFDRSRLKPQPPTAAP
ncbi:recombinase family protein [Amycolatopsis jiangsuensis]|uniref:DNA invertase Pin-like site-specific DNA recombinase n=1 Tax=Amycolatopsis jiangsuensis TaxID=1181879 RepID=A0A840IT48_9PSEU|nr:recombinase family protein [Amycolatopsis jiangsuensis]MBB4684635.1 DNA invertase Pin-like site-specific DNA recombinase [Amycolatopsis jiangsuensis]